jgi:hypothetical protein
MLGFWFGVTMRNDAKDETNDALSMDQYCKYKFVAHTEGVTYSTRLQDLQNCKGVIVATNSNDFNIAVTWCSLPDQTGILWTSHRITAIWKTMADLFAKGKQQDVSKRATGGI